jgi:hypothetical protein
MNFTYEEIGEDAPAIQTVGLFVAVVTARCLKCSYEVDWYNFKKDKLRDSKNLSCLLRIIFANEPQKVVFTVTKILE